MKKKEKEGLLKKIEVEDLEYEEEVDMQIEPLSTA
jgi:hypothetical protein